MEIKTRHWDLSVATEADNDEICRLFRDVHVSGELDVNQEREPDFFALSRLHHGTAHTFVIRDDKGVVSGLGTAISRPAWLDGERITAGYLCDLRIRPRFRGGVTLAKHMTPVLQWVREQTGVEVFNTVVFDENEIARKVLRGPSAKKRGQPIYNVMTPFRMTSVQFTRRRRGPRGRVEKATTDDVTELADFLAEKGKNRVLGEDFTGDLLQRRLRDWPNFGIDRFYVARNAHDRIIGCLAPWDTRAVKRTRVLGYNGKMLWIKRAFNAGSPLLRYPPLPEAGNCFDFAFLTHLEVEDDDPVVFKDLLRAAYTDLRPTGLHFMSALVPRGSRLEGAFGGFMVQHTAMNLYAVPVPGGAFEDREWGTRHPGFEISLS